VTFLGGIHAAGTARAPMGDRRGGTPLAAARSWHGVALRSHLGAHALGWAPVGATADGALTGQLEAEQLVAKYGLRWHGDRSRPH
jgi:hypothetical protein